MIKLDKNRSKKVTNPNVLYRDRILIKEFTDMEETLPTNCQITHHDPNKLHFFQISITAPKESLWTGGIYVFLFDVPEDYNYVPPKVTCKTRIWHPNISENGEVCLSLLRPTALDGMGWAPTRNLKEVVWGVNSLFTDLLNFDDPLNGDAAEQYERDKKAFESKVADFVYKYARPK